MIFIIIIVMVLIGLIVSFSLIQYNYRKKDIYAIKLEELKCQYQDSLRKNEQIKQELEKNEMILNKTNETINIKQQESKLLSSQLIQTNTQLKEAREVYKKLSGDMRNQAIEETSKFKEALLADIVNQGEKMKQKYSEQERELIAAQEPLKKILSDYESRRAAIIEANRREKELQDNQSFHSIQLNKEVIEDIEYIKDLLNKVHNKGIIAKVVWESYIATPAKEMINRVIGKEKIVGIYKITNIKDQQCYIGQGVDVGKRLLEHIKGSLGIQSIADQRIHHAMSDIGIQNWTFELLEKCDKEDLNEKEKYYISFYKSNEYGYNKTIGNK